MKGNNKRLSDTIPGDAYLTPRWAVEFLCSMWQPDTDLLCDPCACGFGGYTIAGHVAEVMKHKNALNLDVELFDIQPRHAFVQQANCLDLQLPQARRTIITNPPYHLLSSGKFMRWAWTQAEEVVVLTRFSYLCAENGKRTENLYDYIQPAKRLAFEVEPQYADRDGVVEDDQSLTGYRLSSTGVDHGWAVFRKGYDGYPTLMIRGV